MLAALQQKVPGTATLPVASHTHRQRCQRQRREGGVPEPYNGPTFTGRGRWPAFRSQDRRGSGPVQCLV